MDGLIGRIASPGSIPACQVMESNGKISVAQGLRATGVSVALNMVLALFKITVGLVGNSYALVADGIESSTDVISSLVVWSGLRISARPADSCHPFGHGKAESIAAVVVACFLLGAAGLIAYQSIEAILEPVHETPAWYTLLALAVIIAIKEGMFRYLYATGDGLESNALKSDAWHHRSDAITSLAAAVGITIALIGGHGYETADQWAALVACGIILFNGIRLLKPAMDEIMDASVPDDVGARLQALAMEVDGVKQVAQSRIRKSGLGLLMDMDVVVDGELTVRAGHEIAEAVRRHILATYQQEVDITVHVEPDAPRGDGRACGPEAG